MRWSAFSLFGFLGLFAAIPSVHAAGEDYGVLIISRERLEIATACDIGVYLQDQLVSRLFQGQSASYNLPPGEVSVRLGIMGDTGCQPSFEQIRSDRVQIRAGAIHKYRVMLLESGLGLRAVDP